MFLRAGSIDAWVKNQMIRNVGSYAYFWSEIVGTSTSNKPTSARRLDITPGHVYPSFSNHRLYGHPLRCLLLG